ncbi:MAG: cobalt-zinc-cadmium efflux system membrane fusion protein, partial [Candidatus Paceibacteria bacterium]
SWPEELPLRPGMFGRVELFSSARQVPVVVPERALVHDNGGDAVFVQVEPLGFELRDVQTRHAAGGVVEITSGLKAGERVVVEGTFLLKSAERQGELGGGHNH